LTEYRETARHQHGGADALDEAGDKKPKKTGCCCASQRSNTEQADPRNQEASATEAVANSAS
jgi:hypothetical protein